jgi:hypothetical protein
MNGLNQIHSQNEAAARDHRAKYKAQLLAQGKTTVCKLDAQGIVDIDVLPLAFDTPEAARGHLNKTVALHLQASYLISTPPQA